METMEERANNSEIPPETQKVEPQRESDDQHLSPTESVDGQKGPLDPKNIIPSEPPIRESGEFQAYLKKKVAEDEFGKEALFDFRPEPDIMEKAVRLPQEIEEGNIEYKVREKFDERIYFSVEIGKSNCRAIGTIDLSSIYLTLQFPQLC
jgi:hypothetical protein